MRDFFEGIQTIFEDYLFAPFNELANMELNNWWLANLVNWIFIIIAFAAFIYWMKQLKKVNDRNEEKRETSAHSFLN
ncbi:DUF6341 family protein [Salinimicrobium xinjiangense]|uniref:DUF6341 family protein n=1 Tax=Salinimicrobium xinjiangense TaxID=438596 RepID=UPI00040F46C5|nr:hypothetical protein [Salinimicrobium xinjiangense]